MTDRSQPLKEPGGHKQSELLSGPGRCIWLSDQPREKLKAIQRFRKVSPMMHGAIPYTLGV